MATSADSENSKAVGRVPSCSWRKLLQEKLSCQLRKSELSCCTCSKTARNAISHEQSDASGKYLANAPSALRSSSWLRPSNWHPERMRGLPVIRARNTCQQ